MKIISKIKSFILLLPMVAGVALTQSCTEDIDTSSRYTFTGNTVLSYLEDHADVYSEYRSLLDTVKVSDFSNSTVSQLLSARGNYTCFAPTNEAIHNYLVHLVDSGIISDSTWNAPEFQEVNPETGMRDLLYQIQSNIVYNSIIDAGDNSAAFQTSDFSERAPKNEVLSLPNMKERKLQVTEGNGTRYAIEGSNIDDNNCNIYTINGYIHQVHKVIDPNEQTVTDIFQKMIEEQQWGFYTYAVLLEACGLYDELAQKEDEVYYQMLMSGELEQHFSEPHPTYSGAGDPERGKGANGGNNSYGWYPKRRMIGYTLFLEKDSWWEQALGLEDSTIHTKPAEEVIALVAEYVKANNYHMPNASHDDNYTSIDNALNQFVTYHVVPGKVENNKLVIHFNEYGYSQDLKQPKSCVYDFYITAGERRLLKTFKSPGNKNTIYLNRFPVINNATDGDYTEVSCEEEKAGVEILVGEMLRPYNAFVYPISDCIYFNEQMAETFGKERIRIDVATFFKEFMTNDIRSNENPTWPYQCVGMPITSKYSYCEDLEIGDDTRFHYLTGRYSGVNSWANYQGDELNVVGNYEMTMKLPPVPKDGVYELRLGLSTNNRRGMCQVYWGTNKNALPAVGVPLDMRMTGTQTLVMSGQSFPSIVGWEPDVKGDDDVNAEVDKKMRNNGYMKGPKYINYIGGNNQLLRDRQEALRKIVIRSEMKANETYYIQFKNVLDNLATEFFMDYIEYCPKEVYDNPLIPEDIW